MSNFFTDNPDILFRFEHLDLARVVELREDGYREAAEFACAPRNLADAQDSYRRILEIAGEIAADFVAPRAEDVDRLGCTFGAGEVCYAPGMVESLERLRQADLMGITLPRRYGGLNFPVTIFTMIVEIISRADASLMNVFGLQSIAETINKFASDEIKEAYLPRFATGEVTGSMALTEPEAGSDLQNVQLRARQGDDGRWYLTGVKRFITNGCGRVSLVLARSEEGSTDGRGLSLFLYERDDHMRIRRIEDKLGIHGSPTCELQFNDAPALLIGERRRGLTTYVMSLMNGARLAVAAQAQGIAEAAYRAAEKYACERVQFGGPIRNLTPVAALLANMKISLEASRALLYETAVIVDLKEGLERRAELHPDEAHGQAKELRLLGRYAALFTPLCKALCSETANAIAYDALQIHGGSGYMRDFAVERHARDARITSIYEGTTQLQVAAAVGGVLSGTLAERLDEYEVNDYSTASHLLTKIRLARSHLDAAVSRIREVNDPRFRDYHARRLVEMAADIVCSYLLARDARHSPHKLLVAQQFVEDVALRSATRAQAVVGSRPETLDILFVLGSDRLGA